MQLVYRLYLVQIILLLLSMMLPGILKVITIVLLCLLMFLLWYILWGAARLARKTAQDERKMDTWLRKMQPRR